MFFYENLDTCNKLSCILSVVVFKQCAGAKIEVLEKTAKNYYAVLDENRKLHNEVQDLKGNTV